MRTDGCGVKEIPAMVGVPGCCRIVKWVAGPGFTVNVPLVAGRRRSPDVTVAVIETPPSAFVYVTPVMVTEFEPEGIVPDTVPPRTPDPEARERETVVDSKTF